MNISLRIKIENNLIKLIDSCQDGKIRIWNFHSGDLLNKELVWDNHSLVMFDPSLIPEDMIL